MNSNMTVTKRCGARETIDLDKIHRVITWAAKGLKNVSVSEVELRTHLQFFDGIPTEAIHETIIKSAADLISPESPDYQFLAARLAVFHLRKKAFGQFEPPKLYDHVTKLVELGKYDMHILQDYTREELDIMDTYIDHWRDMNFSYAAVKQLEGKYLVQNRVTHEIYESAQFLYILVAACLFARYPKETRLQYVKDFYDAVSTFKISLPTPIMAGVRTVRGGAATLFYPIWHLEVESLLVLKNNRGVEDNRIRHLDYGVQLNKLMYQRLIKGESISLFSPSDVPGLYDAFFEDQAEFERLYLQYEQDSSIRKKTLKAVDLFSLMMQERASTGRIYIQNVDHCNTHSPFDSKVAPIRQSNLCLEIALPTKPLNNIDDPNGEIALCTLSALNLGTITDLAELEPLADLAVRALDNLLDYQDYPIKAAQISSMNRRTLGIGVINFANYLAKHEVLRWQREQFDAQDL